MESCIAHDPERVCSSERADERARQRGTSLIELMVGLVILATILGATLSTAAQSSKQRQGDAELSLAFAACANNLEELRSVAFATLPTFDGAGFDVPGIHGAPGGLQPVPGDPDGLPGQLAVTVDSSSGGVTLYRAKASVAWSGARGRRSFELETLIGERK